MALVSTEKAPSPREPLERLEHIAQRAGRLYSLPSVAVEVLELTAQPAIDAFALKQCIEKDPALTAKILRIVNSSLFGLTRKVTDLHQAIALLGIKPLKLLVLGFSLPERLWQGPAAAALARFWEFALVKAVAARELTEELQSRPGDEAFLAGLLQDLGVLVLLQELGPPYARLVESASTPGRELLALEQQTFGFDHRQLSVRLLEQWRLPPALINAIAEQRPHEGPLPIGGGELLPLAESLAIFLTTRRTDVLLDILEQGHHRRRMTIERLATLVRHLDATVRELADALAIELPLAHYAEILAQAHAQLSQVSTAAARELLDGCQGAAADLDADQELEVPPAPCATGSASVLPLESERHPQLNLRRNATAVVESPLDWAANSGLTERLQIAVRQCRQARSPLSLLLAEVDGFQQLVLLCGEATGQRLITWLQRSEDLLELPGVAALQLSAERIAMVLPHCARQEAVAFAHRLQSQQAAWRGGHVGVRLSVGVATAALPAKNFAVDALLTKAESCLRAAQLSGGGAVKSIEL